MKPRSVLIPIPSSDKFISRMKSNEKGLVGFRCTDLEIKAIDEAARQLGMSRSRMLRHVSVSFCREFLHNQQSTGDTGHDDRQYELFLDL